MATNASTMIRESDARAADAEGSPRPYAIDVDLYERIVGSGVFGDKPPFFLWKGRLVTNIPQGDHFRPYLIPVDLYEDLILAGVFSSSDRLYLWKGVLVEKMTKGPYHSYGLARLQRFLLECTPEGWHVRQETPIRMPDDSEPEPDLTVVRGSDSKYKKQTPTWRDVALVVEVADSSLETDAGDKREKYAAAAIPVYWIVNLINESIDVYSDPVGVTQTEPARYRELSRYRNGDEVPVVLDGRAVGRIAVSEVI